MNDSQLGCNGSVYNTIPQWQAILNASLLILVVITSLFGNTLVCLAIYKFPRLQNLTNALLFSLAVTDILSPMIRPIFIATAMLKRHWIFGCDWCKLCSCFGTFLSSASILHLLAISIERYLMIGYPYKYKQWVTKRSLVTAVLLMWIVSLFMGMLPYTRWIPMQFNEHLLDCEVRLNGNPELSILLAFCYFVVPFIAMVLVYLKIYMSVKRQTKQISFNCLENKAQKLRKEWRAAKIVVVIVGVFFVLWLPYFLVNAIRSYNKHVIPGWTMRLVWTLAYANSCCNWMIYSVMNKPIRGVFKKMLCFDSRKRNN